MPNTVAIFGEAAAPLVKSSADALGLVAPVDGKSFNSAILNSLAAGIAVIDLDGVIREVNDSWRQFAIANSAEASVITPHTDIGTNYLAICAATSASPEGLSPSYAGILAVLNGELPQYTLEYPCHSPTEQRWFVMCVQPLGSHQCTGAVIAHTNISEYKRMGLALQAKNDELEIARHAADKANRAKSDFLSSMSHELRSPLGAILGFAQLIETGTPPPTPTQKHNVGQILQAGWYQLALINDILDLALVESGKLSLVLEPVRLSDVLLECEAMVEAQAARRDIRVVFARPQATLFVKADRTRLKQVLVNLLDNAIKYNKDGGFVTVDFVATESGFLRINVTDTGTGLSPAQLTQLYQPFNRLGHEQNGTEGTGIGLVMTKRLVELMGGNIRVESEYGRGSVFSVDLTLVSTAVLLPATTPVSEPAASAAQPCAAEPAHTMLYVEDNLANLKLVEAVIARRADVRMLSAPDGHTGLTVARAEMPDMILMDITLPGMSGLQALAILKNDPVLKHIPVVALSANAMPHDIERGLAAGFFDYLTKPFKINELMTALDAAIAFSATPRLRPYHPFHAEYIPKDTS